MTWNSKHAPADFESEEWPHGEHLLAHIVALDLENARFLSRRVPIEVKTGDQLFKKAHLLLQQLWNNDYPGAWNTLNFEWPCGHAVTLIEQIKHSLKKRIFEMACQAFRTIHAASLAKLLHCSEEEAISAAISQGANFCESSGYVCLETASIQHRKQKLDGRDIQKLQSVLVQIHE
eukprot:jgi/Picsp_1/4991/NSC_02354-R1_cop9 signalosome complex subunit 8